jgi:succinyl-CoA synthetase beta subunit
MDLLEYQAKELFREIGIPVLPSQTIAEARQLKQLKIPYPVVLKSQVRAGGRGKAGGIRFVANTIDAIAAAHHIFNLSILGEYPQVILAEAHYNAEKELFLALVLDYKLKCPVLLGSSRGGMNVKPLLENLQQVAIEEEFSPFYARRLAVRMGLSGELIASVSRIVEKMYRLFRQKDLELIEINPLGINHRGELMALDGKIAVNDLALAKHPTITALNKSSSVVSISDREPVRKIANTKIEWLDWQDKGKIAIIANHGDLISLTGDLICKQKGKPLCSTVIVDNIEPETPTVDFYRHQIRQCWQELIQMKGLKVVLINIWQTETIERSIVKTLIDCELESRETSEMNEPSKSDNEPKLIPELKFVLRLINKLDEKLELQSVAEWLYVTDNLELAVEQTITWAKTK